MILLYIYIKKLLWFGVTILLILSSIYFSFKLRFSQLNIKRIKRTLKKSKSNKPFDTLFLSLGGRIGVGSLAGTALAIYIGGSGTIFWLFITSILTSILAYVETYLGNKYKIKSNDGIYHGGPSYYLKSGLNFRNLSKIYAFLLIVSYIFGFLGIQSNTITITLGNYINISKYLIAFIISFITLIIIFGGAKEIIQVSNKIVPFMAILYVVTSLIIIILNISKLPNVILSIISNAFNIKPFFSSFIPMVIIGLQRGIFSSEAGLGTGAVASSISDDDNYIGQGFIQIIGVHISTIICILTSLVILISDLDINNLNGIEITILSFHKMLGVYGDFVIILSILLFSFSTIITGYYYGESGLYFFLKKNIKFKLFILKCITILSIFIGGIISAVKIWDFVDILVALLAYINVIALFLLRKEIFFYDK